MVFDTILILNDTYPTTSTFFDKFQGNFQAKPRGSTLNAILCEKGKIFTERTKYSLYCYYRMSSQFATDITEYIHRSLLTLKGYTHRSLLTLQGTPTGPYCHHNHKKLRFSLYVCMPNITGYIHRSLLIL